MLNLINTYYLDAPVLMSSFTLLQDGTGLPANYRHKLQETWRTFRCCSSQLDQVLNWPVSDTKSLNRSGRVICGSQDKLLPHNSLFLRSNSSPLLILLPSEGQPGSPCRQSWLDTYRGGQPARTMVTQPSIKRARHGIN